MAFPTLSRNVSATLLVALIAPGLFAQDFDGDAIPDSIENQSWYLAAGGSPEVQDVWVECDWMPGTVWGRGQLRRRMEAVFARAPVEGGIALHLAFGSTIPFEEQWGDFQTAEGYVELWAKASATMAANLDAAPFAGANATTMRPYMHYCAFVNAIDATGTSGASLKLRSPALGIPGDLFLIALGQYAEVIPGPSRRRFQAGTFLHELGHNLGLSHGGARPRKHTNYKPNYLSVMNYHHQGGFLRLAAGNTARRFNYWDFSRSGSEKIFDEREINEGEGIVLEPGADLAATPAAQRLLGLTYCEDGDLRAFFWNAQMDFNCNGLIDGGLVRTDTNLDGRTNNLGKVQADWQRLRFNGVAAGGAPAGGLESYEPLREMDRLLIEWMFRQDRRLRLDQSVRRK